jgi:Ribonuclease BN-like family.
VDWLQRYISPTAFKAGPAGLINLVAVIALFMGALNILVTAERVFNHIWKAKASRPYFQKVTAFWVLLTSSPFIILASISIGNLIAPSGGAVETFLANHWWARLIYHTIIPIVVESTCFGLMYFSCLLPCCFYGFTSVYANNMPKSFVYQKVCWLKE